MSSYDLGANSDARKPVDFAEFTEAIRQLGLYWLILNVAPPRTMERSNGNACGPAGV